MATEFDTVIVGAGIAGLAAGALLARTHGQRVLVLERSPFIGGRTLSFVGRGDKVLADGLELDAAAFRKALPRASAYLGKCTPDIETIFARGLLDGRTFEAGGHGLFWGNRSRVSCLLDALGVHHEIPVNRGLGYLRWEGEDRPARAWQVHKGRPYPWMSDAGFEATMEQMREMGRMTLADVAASMDISLQQWFERRAMHPQAYDFLKVLAASQTAQAEPAMTPAGDFLGYMAMAGPIGMNLVSGSVGCAATPGPIALAQQLERVLLAHGGRVARATPVREVLVEGGRVRGVRVDDDSARDPAHDAARDAARDGPPPPRGTIRAERVIVTAPPREIFRVLDPGLFPARWVDEIRGRYWGAGLLTGWCGMRRSLLPEIGLDASSFVYMPAVIRDEGFIGAVDMVMCEFTAWGDGAARRAPPGRHDYYFSTALTEREMRDPARVGRVVELCEAWARRTFRDFDADCEFIVWTPGPDAYGHWRPVGSRRPDVRSPWVEGLHFAGDQYGERLWGGGVDAAALSAVLCVDAITGGELESQILPEHHRGLPRAVA